MGFLLDAVSQKKFEISAHRPERAGPASTASLMAWWASGWGGTLSAHPPYSGKPSVMWRISTGLDVNDLKQFFLRWYGPNNATLTLGGDF